MTAVVIAGGKSRRMKTDKAFVKIGQTRLIDRVLQTLTPLFSEVVINSNTPEAYTEWTQPIISDIYPNKGALGGIYTALKYARTEYVFCVACDMPLLNPALIRFMLAEMNGCDVLIPRTPDGVHPLHAIYAKRCCGIIWTLLQQNRLKIANLFDLIHTKYVPVEQIRQYDPNLESFLNLNTLADLQLARKKVS